MDFGSQNVAPDQVQQWIAQNPQFAQAVVQSMAAPSAALRYQPMGQNQNWVGRNAFPMTQTSTPSAVPPAAIPVLHGRVVGSPQEIRPNEIPMDGTASLFPMADDSCIYAKAWGPDGMIQTIRYVPEKPIDGTQPQTPSEFDQVIARLDKIEQLLGQRYQKQNYNNRSVQSGQVNSKYDPNSKTEAVNNG